MTHILLKLDKKTFCKLKQDKLELEAKLGYNIKWEKYFKKVILEQYEELD